MKRRHAESDDDGSEEGGGEEDEQQVEGEKEEEQESEPLKDLEALLRSIEQPGDFSCGGHVTLCLPGLSINGVGPVSVPISPDVAVRLLPVFSQAPFGRGELTVFDKTVRDTWQVAPDKFTIGNPAWKSKVLAPMISAVKKDLGCGDGKVQADLYKLLLYEKGQHFVAHRDTEKSPGMFGTLVVMLPSFYTGGALLVKHGGKEVVFDYAAQNSYELFYCAFYADCKHEVRTIESGYRMCLVYNLVHRGSGLPPALRDRSDVAHRIAKVIAAWVAHGEPSKVAIMLGHSYTQEGLSFAVLKNKDRAIAQVLRLARAEFDFECFLAIVVRSESGSGDGSAFRGWEMVDAEADTNLKKFVGMAKDAAGSAEDNGADLENIALDDDETIPIDYWESQGADDESVEEATGNEGATMTRQYNRAAIVLIPKPFREQLMLQNLQPNAVVQYVLRCIKEQRLDSARKALTRFMETNSKCGAEAYLLLLRQLHLLDSSPSTFNYLLGHCFPIDLLKKANLVDLLFAECKRVGWTVCMPGLADLVSVLDVASALIFAGMLTNAAGQAEIESASLLLISHLSKQISGKLSAYSPYTYVSWSTLASANAVLLLAHLKSLSLRLETFVSWLDCLAPVLLRQYPQFNSGFIQSCTDLAWPPKAVSAVTRIFAMRGELPAKARLIREIIPHNLALAGDVLVRLVLASDQLFPALTKLILGIGQQLSWPPLLCDALFARCRSNRDVGELLDIVCKVLARNPALASDLLSRIVRDGDRALIQNYAQLVGTVKALEARNPSLPALNSVVQFVTRELAKTVPLDTRVLKALSGTRSVSVIAEALRNLLKAQLNATPALPPAVAQAQLPAQFELCCADCIAFSRHFLSGSTAPFRLRAKEASRKHVMSKVTAARLGVTMTEERQGTPHTLVIWLSPALAQHHVLRSRRAVLQQSIDAAQRFIVGVTIPRPDAITKAEQRSEPACK